MALVIAFYSEPCMWVSEAPGGIRQLFAFPLCLPSAGCRARELRSCCGFSVREGEAWRAARGQGHEAQRCVGRGLPRGGQRELPWLRAESHSWNFAPFLVLVNSAAWLKSSEFTWLLARAWHLGVHSSAALLAPRPRVPVSHPSPAATPVVSGGRQRGSAADRGRKNLTRGKRSCKTQCSEIISMLGK